MHFAFKEPFFLQTYLHSFGHLSGTLRNGTHAFILDNGSKMMFTRYDRPAQQIRRRGSVRGRWSLNPISLVLSNEFSSSRALNLRKRLGQNRTLFVGRKTLFLDRRAPFLGSALARRFCWRGRLCNQTFDHEFRFPKERRVDAAGTVAHGLHFQQIALLLERLRV